MAEIRLPSGHIVLVDDADLGLLQSFSWHVTHNGRHPYAGTNVGARKVKMHRMLTNAPLGMVVDHINGNSLDNRRCNLRVVTSSVNSRNRTKPDRDSRTGLLGVSRNRNGFRARLTINGAERNLGTFPSAEEASEARRRAELNAFGELCAAHQQ